MEPDRSRDDSGSVSALQRTVARAVAKCINRVRANRQRPDETQQTDAKRTTQYVAEAVSFFVACLEVFKWESNHPAHEALLVASLVVFVISFDRLVHGGSEHSRQALIAMALSLGLGAATLAYRPAEYSSAHSSPKQPGLLPMWQIVQRPEWIGPGLRALAGANGQLWGLDDSGTVEMSHPGNLTQPGTLYPTHAFGSGLAAGDGRVATVHSDHVTVRNAVTGGDARTARLGTGPGPVALGPDALWTGSGASSKVYRLDMDGRVMKIGVPGPPNGIVLVRGAAWVATNATKRSPGYLVHLVGDTDTAPRPLPTGAKLLGFAFNTFWFSVNDGIHPPQLVRWSLSESQLGNAIQLDSPAVAIARLGSSMFVIERNEELLQIDPATNRPRSSTVIDEPGMPNVSGLAALSGGLFVSSSFSGDLMEVRFNPPQHVSRRAGVRHEPREPHQATPKTRVTGR